MNQGATKTMLFAKPVNPIDSVHSDKNLAEIKSVQKSPIDEKLDQVMRQCLVGSAIHKKKIGSFNEIYSVCQRFLSSSKKELINNATLEKLLDIASKKISRCFKEPEIIFELSMVLRDLLLFEGENTAQLQAKAKETSAPKARFS